MSLTFSQTQGNGSTLSYSIIAKSGYFEDEDITVELISVSDGTVTEQTLDTDYTIEDEAVIFAVAPTSDYYVRIRRNVTLETTYSDFTRGNVFGPDNLNNTMLQALYQIQQLADGFRPDDHYWKADVNAGSRRIKNLAEATDAGDAVRYSQIEDIVTELSLVSSYADAAEVSSTTAEGFSVAAGLSATAAADQADAAALSSDEAAASAEAISDSVDAIALNTTHRARTDNPHSVTAAQIGYTASDVLSKLLTVHGSGSGLDADKLDGKDSTAFPSIGNIAPGLDLNDIVTSGMYSISTGTNVPVGCEEGQLLVIRGTGATIAQVAFSYDSSEAYWRSGNPTQVGGSGAWGPWVSFATMGIKSSRSTTGTWTITGLIPGRPLYLVANTDVAAADSGFGYRAHWS